MYLLPYYVSFISLRRQPCLNDVTNTPTPLPPFFWKKCDFNSTILDSNQWRSSLLGNKPQVTDNILFMKSSRAGENWEVFNFLWCKILSAYTIDV